MVGKIISINHVTDFFDRIELEEVESKEVHTMTVNRLSDDMVGRTVSVYTQVTQLSNSDYGHVYPQGTIGT